MNTMAEKRKSKPPKIAGGKDNKEQTAKSVKKTDDQSKGIVDLAPLQQLELDSFIRLVGQRVHQARKTLRMSRRVLSEKSGVSQRTIVLLESGVGNISIALLFRLSKALDQSVQSFMSADNAIDAKQKRICLIGLRGAGKSTLGKNLSQKTDTSFVELNDEIEALCGMSVQELMDLYGPEGYRKLEQQALKQITNQKDDIIIAAAGGVVNEEETYSWLLKHFHTIWLRATPEEHIDRVRKQGDERPMAGNPEAMTVLKSILVSREAHYQMADCTIDTSGQSVKNSTDEIVKAAQQLLSAQ